MTEQLNTDSRFRSALAGELPAWVRRGIIDPAQARKLELLYELGELQNESAKLFSRAIMGFGGLLLGGGVMAFVAANWEELPKFLKVILLFATLLGFHGAGFWLWQKKDHERLGRALIFAGCLVFGANIGLLAQIFNIQGDTYRGFGAWALGTLPVAWAIRSSSSALLALVLSLVWFLGFINAHHDKPTTDILVTGFPFFIAGVYGALAAITRSRRVMGTTIAAFFISMGVAGGYGIRDSAVPLAVTLITAGWLALAAGRFFETHERTAAFGAVGQVLGWLLIGVVGLIFSYTDLWEHFRSFHEYRWLIPAVAAVVAGAWAMSEGLVRRPAEPWEKNQLFLLVASLATLCLALGANHSVISPLLTNIACLGWAGVFIFRGLNAGDRAAFWSGAVLVFLLIAARFFEFETSLMQKSAAFLACGAGTIYAGIRYEAHLRTKEAAR